ncbi:hypothetical protein V6N12_011675 [Hibiscus sabdariffa]|uniref:Uncharacterized protein n=1 Tax=Hibiscus sabdariffa TaxID=183260 RepID=A0ABR2B5T1_9ROSI
MPTLSSPFRKLHSKGFDPFPIKLPSKGLTSEWAQTYERKVGTNTAESGGLAQAFTMNLHEVGRRFDIWFQWTTRKENDCAGDEALGPHNRRRQRRDQAKRHFIRQRTMPFSIKIHLLAQLTVPPGTLTGHMIDGINRASFDGLMVGCPCSNKSTKRCRCIGSEVETNRACLPEAAMESPRMVKTNMNNKSTKAKNRAKIKSRSFHWRGFRLDGGRFK